MRFLVTGASGFVGRHLVRRLAAHGHDVTALTRRPVTVPGARTVRGDITTGAGLPHAVAQADVVVHLAAVTHAARPQTYARVNTLGTARLAAAVAACPRPPRLVYCSSLAASGPGRLRGAEHTPGPVSAYGRSKLGGEHALRVTPRVPAVVVRPPIVHGPGDPAFLPHLAAAVRAGVLPVVGRPGPRHYSLLHVEDLCGALLTAAEVGTAGTVYHVSDGHEHRWEDIAAAVASVLGRRAPRTVHIPVPVASALARTLGRAGRLNADKIREAAHPAWTSAPGPLPFTARMVWPQGLRTALGAPP
ncbi:NAD-dependent epimerase/dehydratase family protein [Streptomyces gamaensis]|uniref:NAD-dependent epimerase/dehydratase family protein n=1 Tax=Streptomyces gamaensis TaxID=1763542 RepID=A0ABW0ZD45_9ACTN